MKSKSITKLFWNGMFYKKSFFSSFLLTLIFTGCAFATNSSTRTPKISSTTPAILNNKIIYHTLTEGLVALDPVQNNSAVLTKEDELQLRMSASPNGLRIICCKQLAFGPYEDETNITTINTFPWDETIFEPYTAQWSASGDTMIVGVQVIGDASDQLGRFALYAMDRETLEFSTIGEGLINIFDISMIDDQIVIAKVQDTEGQDTEEAGVYIVDITEYTFERVIGAPYVYSIAGLRLSPDGNWLAISHSDGVDLIDLTELTLQTLSSQVSIYSLNWSPNNQWLAGIG